MTPINNFAQLKPGDVVMYVDSVDNLEYCYVVIDASNVPDTQYVLFERIWSSDPTTTIGMRYYADQDWASERWYMYYDSSRKF